MFKNKRIIAIAMTLLMVVSMLPGMVFAEGVSLASYDEISGYDVLDKNGKAVKVPLTDENLHRYGQYGMESGKSFVSMYFYHGADIENGDGFPEIREMTVQSEGVDKVVASSIDNIYNPYYAEYDSNWEKIYEKEYDYDYTIESVHNEDGTWTNYIRNIIDAENTFDFGVLIAGSGMNWVDETTMVNNVKLYSANESGIYNPVELNFEKAKSFDSVGNDINGIYQCITGYDNYVKNVFEGCSLTDKKLEYAADKDGNKISGIGREVGATFHFSIDDLVEGTDYKLVLCYGSIPEMTFYFSTASTPDYEITSGENSTWTENSDGSLTITGNGDFTKFQDVKVDGKIIDKANYDVKSGSTIITLKKDYLDTLSAGTHTFEIVWTDGSASTNFTVKAADNPGNPGGGDQQNLSNPGDNGNNNGGDNTNTDNPAQTGDDMNMTLYVVLMLVAMLTAAGAVAYRRQRQ